MSKKSQRCSKKARISNLASKNPKLATLVGGLGLLLTSFASHCYFLRHISFGFELLSVALFFD